MLNWSYLCSSCGPSVPRCLSVPFCPLAASVLQPQHGGDVRQHPEQAAAAETQHFQRSQTPAGGPAAEGPNQEAGLHGGLCKYQVTWACSDMTACIKTSFNGLSSVSLHRLKLRTTYSSPRSTGTNSMPRKSPLLSTPTWYVPFSRLSAEQ